MKSFQYSLTGLLSAAAIFTACGDDVIRVSQKSFETAGNFEDMEKCSAAIDGKTVFVSDSGRFYVCADSTWKKAVESGYISADSSAKTDCFLRDNGDGSVTQVCGKDSVLLSKALCAETPYDPDSLFCAEGILYAKFGGKAYDPELEVPFGGMLAKKSLAWRYRNPNVEYDTILDARDGRAYLTVQLGGQTWMAENLNYRGEGSDTLGICFNSDEAECDLDGRFYGWFEAMDLELPQDTSEEGKFEDSIPENARGICPEGFRVPTKAEYKRLQVLLDSLGYRGADLVANAFNTFGFGILLSGFCDVEDDQFYGREEDSYFWTYNPEASGFERVVKVRTDIVDIFYTIDYYSSFARMMPYRHNLRCVRAQKN